MAISVLVIACHSLTRHLYGNISRRQNSSSVGPGHRRILIARQIPRRATVARSRLLITVVRRIAIAMRHIYLDYNTTTPLAPEVQEAMVPFLAEFYGAPGGSHWLARASAEAIEDARSRLATLLGAAREDLVFTGGGTESVNLAVKGTVLRQR